MNLPRLLALIVVSGSLASCITERVPIYPTHPEQPSAAAPVAPRQPPPPPPGAVTDQVGRYARFQMLFGYRSYASNWDPFDDQFAFQFGGTHEWPTVPVGVEWNFGFASVSKTFDNTRFTNQNFEVSVGPTKTFHLGGGKWFANLGAGVAWTYTEEGDTSYCCSLVGESDGWWAGYAHSALIYRISPQVDIALDLRGLTGEDVELGDFVLDGQYWQLGLGFGFAI